jgi:TatA/E family protein of Tat protein translocase
MSGGEILLIVVVILLLFGADKIPEFARTWGKGMREFRKATDEIRRELESPSNPLKSLKDEVTAIGNETVREVTGSLESDMDSYQKHYSSAEASTEPDLEASSSGGTSVSATASVAPAQSSEDAVVTPPRRPHAAWKETPKHSA